MYKRQVSKSWVPIGNKDYSSVIAAIPDDVDAVYVALGGADAVNFLTQYQQAGGTAPLVGGSITVDQSVLGVQGTLRDTVIGMPAAGPMADNNPAPEWQAFVTDYKAAFADGFPSPSLFAQGYYINTLAALTGLDAVDGDLSDGGVKYRAALSGLTLDTLRWAFSTFHLGNWIPLTWISLATDISLFGPDPGAQHLVNLALHAAATVFLYAFLCRSTGRPGRSAVVAALFAVHPLHVESVAWISERKDVLSTLFWFATLLQYQRWVRRRGARNYLATLGLFLLGLLCKPCLLYTSPSPRD